MSRNETQHAYVRTRLNHIRFRDSGGSSPSLARYLIAKEEAYRCRVALEIHDGVSQTVAAALACAEVARAKALSSDACGASTSLGEVRGILLECQEELRHLAH